MNDNTRVQNTLPFDAKVDTTLKKFILPDFKLLKAPSKNEKTAKKNDNINEEFLESLENFNSG